MRKLTAEQRKPIIAALVEGSSINSTVRMTGVAKTTILRLLEELGCACAAYHHEHVRDLKPNRVVCDEVWAFVHCKQKHVGKAASQKAGIGDVWTWTAIDPETKLIMSFHVGLRTPDDAAEFMLDLAGRITNITQLTTDGLTNYPIAVRMSIRRFTRLTNGHSKKIENHGHAFALFLMHYNFCRKRASLEGKTPAMAAGLSDRVWTLEELVSLG